MIYSDMETVIDLLVVGQSKDALELLHKGCKSKPFVLASRALRTCHELEAMQLSGISSKLYNAILYKAENS